MMSDKPLDCAGVPLTGGVGKSDYVPLRVDYRPFATLADKIEANFRQHGPHAGYALYLNEARDVLHALRVAQMQIDKFMTEPAPSIVIDKDKLELSSVDDITKPRRRWAVRRPKKGEL